MEFSEAHKAFVIATLSGIERSLERAAARIEVTAPASLFPEFAADAAAEQREEIARGLASFQLGLAELLDQCGVMPEQASISGLHAFRVALEFAQVSLDEIAARRLLQLGSLDPFACIEIDRRINRLRQILRDLRASSIAMGHSGSTCGD